MLDNTNIVTIIEPPLPVVEVVVEPPLPEIEVIVSEVGLVGPRGIDGTNGIDAVEAVEAAVTAHISSTSPHPIYDDGPSFILLYQNAKV